MKEIEVGGHTYQVGRLNVFDQLTVVKRLGPLISSLMKTSATARGADAGEDVRSVLMRVVPDIAAGLSELKDEDAILVVKKCLAKVSRQEGPGWKNVIASGPSQSLMYEDIDLRQMLELTWAVIESSLETFFSSPAPKSQAPVA